MLNAYSLGFIGVATVALFGVDYIVQSKSAGAAPGEYSIGQYVDSITGRFAAAQAEKEKAERQAELAKVHLPEAPEGWERREWEPELEDGFDISIESDADAEKELNEALNNSPVARMIQAQGNAETRQAARDQVWEYVRGDEVIRISAKYSRPQKRKGFQALAMEMVATNMGMMSVLEGYAVVQGVPVFRVVGMEEFDPNAKDVARPLRLEAHMGREISLGVYAEAKDESVRELLALIDFDGLNAMLHTPLEGVGKAAPVLSLEEQIARAELAAEAHRKGELNKSRKLEEQMIEQAAAISGTPTVGAELAPQPEAKPAAGSEPQQEASLTSKIFGFFSGGDEEQLASAEGTAPEEAESSGGLFGMFSGGSAEETPAAPPKRLKLSGGKSCLSNSVGKFCGN